MAIKNIDAKRASFLVETDRKGNITRVVAPNKLVVADDLDWSGRALAQSYKTSSTALTTSFADIPFEFDGELNGVTRPETDRFKISRAGKYMISYFIAVTETASADSVLLVRVRINDLTVIVQSDAHAGQNPSVGREGVGHSFIVDLSAGDFITLQARATAVGASQSVGGATEERSSLMIMEI